MNKDYLPSKIFIIRIVSILTIIVLIFGISKLFTYLKNRISNKGVSSITIGEVIQNDANSNGIPDWEEYLWGLDPAKNGDENKEFILSKKNSLIKVGGLDNNDTEEITENEILSRQFFATIVSLQQTGSVNDESLQSVSDSLSSGIVATPLSNIYTKNSLNIVPTTEKSKINYHTEFAKLVEKYNDADIGSELTIISQAIANEDSSIFSGANSIASAYRSFGFDLTKIPVPDSIYSVHLSLVNNYEKTALSIEGMAKTLTDPMIAMKSLINYKEYSDSLVADIEKLSVVLQ